MFARALAREPSLIVIDDPVAHAPARANATSSTYCCAHSPASAGSACSWHPTICRALQGFDVFMSISARELCSSEGCANVVPFPSPPSLGPASTGS